MSYTQSQIKEAETLMKSTMSSDEINEYESLTPKNKENYVSGFIDNFKEWKDAYMNEQSSQSGQSSQETPPQEDDGLRHWRPNNQDQQNQQGQNNNDKRQYIQDQIKATKDAAQQSKQDAADAKQSSQSGDSQSATDAAQQAANSAENAAHEAQKAADAAYNIGKTSNDPNVRKSVDAAQDAANQAQEAAHEAQEAADAADAAAKKGNNAEAAKQAAKAAQAAKQAGNYANQAANAAENADKQSNGEVGNQSDNAQEAAKRAQDAAKRAQEAAAAGDIDAAQEAAQEAADAAREAGQQAQQIGQQASQQSSQAGQQKHAQEAGQKAQQAGQEAQQAAQNTENASNNSKSAHQIANAAKQAAKAAQEAADAAKEADNVIKDIENSSKYKEAQTGHSERINDTKNGGIRNNTNTNPQPILSDAARKSSFNGKVAKRMTFSGNDILDESDYEEAKKIAERAGQPVDAEDYASPTDTAAKKYAEVKNILKKMKQSNPGFGNAPIVLSDTLDKLFATKIDWKDKLRDFMNALNLEDIEDIMAKRYMGLDPNHAKYGSRYLHPYEERSPKRSGIAEVFFLVDSSGSMGFVCGDGRDVFEHIMSEFIQIEMEAHIKKSAYAPFNCGTITEADVIVWDDEDVPNEDEIKEKLPLPKAGGGTSVCDAINSINDYDDIYNRDITLLIIATDGEDNYNQLKKITTPDQLNNIVFVITNSNDGFLESKKKELVNYGIDENHIITVNVETEWGATK